MTIITRTHYLRPYNLSGAAKRSRAEKIKKLLEVRLVAGPIREEDDIAGLQRGRVKIEGAASR